jgi:hypothetical protein
MGVFINLFICHYYMVITFRKLYKGILAYTSMEKRQPTAPYIMDLTGGSEQYLQSVYKGLLDVPMDQLYPFMNFDELVQVSDDHRRWRVRDAKQQTDSFGSFVRSHTIPQTLGHLINRGWSTYDYLHGEVAERNKNLHE